MSAFLEALVARIAGGPDVVRPRLAALFEPGRLGEGPPAITEEASSSAAGLATVMVEPADGATTAASGKQEAGASLMRPTTTSAGPAARMQDQEAGRIRVQPKLAPVAASEPAAAPPRLSRQILRGEQPVPADRTGAAGERPSAPSPSDLAGERHESAPSPLASAAKVVPPNRHPRIARLQATGAGDGSGRFHLLAEPPAPRPMVRPRGPAVVPQSTAAERLRAGPPPAVEITIGRIEVRAVSAPTTSQRPASKSAPTPALSLDDYLAQRDGERR